MRSQLKTIRINVCIDKKTSIYDNVRVVNFINFMDKLRPFEDLSRYARLGIVALALVGCISPLAHAGEPPTEPVLNDGLVDTCEVMGPDGVYTVYTGKLMSKRDAEMAMGDGTSCVDSQNTYNGYTPDGNPYQVDVTGLSPEEVEVIFGQGTGDPGR